MPFKNKDDYNAYQAVRRAATRAIIEEAKDNPCLDCGIKYPPYVMQFDHLGDKKFNIGSATAHNPKPDKLRAEIAKCEVVCANCHAIRTYNRRMRA